MKNVVNTIFKDAELCIIRREMTEDEKNMFKKTFTYAEMKSNIEISSEAIKNGMEFIDSLLLKKRFNEKIIDDYNIGPFIYWLIMTINRNAILELEEKVNSNKKIKTKLIKYIEAAKIMCERYEQIYNLIKHGVEYKQTDFYKGLKEMGINDGDDKKYEIIRELYLGIDKIGEYYEITVLLSTWDSLNMINLYKKGRFLYFKKIGVK